MAEGLWSCSPAFPGSVCKGCVTPGQSSNTGSLLQPWYLYLHPWLQHTAYMSLCTSKGSEERGKCHSTSTTGRCQPFEGYI